MNSVLVNIEKMGLEKVTHNDYKDIQKFVGGLITQAFHIGDYVGYCNDTGVIDGLPIKTIIKHGPDCHSEIAGNILIVKDDGIGGDAPLDEQDYINILNGVFLVSNPLDPEEQYIYVNFEDVLDD